MTVHMNQLPALVGCWVEWFVGPPKKCITLKSLNEWDSRKGTFQKNASKRGEFQIVRKMTCPVLLFKNVCYSPLFETLFWKSALSRPPINLGFFWWYIFWWVGQATLLSIPSYVFLHGSLWDFRVQRYLADWVCSFEFKVHGVKTTLKLITFTVKI